jgi:hypothetical protein
VDVAGGRGVLAKAVLAATSAERATVTDITSVVNDCTADVPNLEFKVRSISIYVCSMRVYDTLLCCLTVRVLE